MRTANADLGPRIFERRRIRGHVRAPQPAVGQAMYDRLVMKAVLLAGGLGTRLRPLTLNTPKPIVPLFNRPFLYYQIDLLKRLPEIDEVILSLNYQPDRIRAIVGDGKEAGLPIRYLVEPSPRGTGGAIKFAEPNLDSTVMVFNGDVLTQTDLKAVMQLHRDRRARATIVLTPVDNPLAYGLVETDEVGNVKRFLEKPSSDEIASNTINAGIYVLEPDTFGRIPTDTNYSIERMYFPSLVEHGERFVAFIDRGYWLDVGTPATYLQAHLDIMSGQHAAVPFEGQPTEQLIVSPSATIDPAARLVGPCFVGAGARIEARARLGPYTVVGRSTIVKADAVVQGSVLWAESLIGDGATVRDAIVGRRCRIGDHAWLGPGTVVGDGSTITSYSRTP